MKFNTRTTAKIALFTVAALLVTGIVSAEPTISPGEDKTVSNGEFVKIEGYATGYEWEELKIWELSKGDNYYNVEKEEDCSGYSCDIAMSFQGSDTYSKFYIEGIRSSGASESDTITVTWEETETFDIIDYGPSGTQEDEDVQLFVELDRNPDSGWCKWQEGNSVERDSSTLMAKPDSSSPEWEKTESFDEGDHTVSFQCFNHDRAITGEKTTSFTVEEEKARPEIELIRPEDGTEDVSRNPLYKWKITDRDDSEMEGTTIYIEEKDFEDDEPWNVPDYKYDVSDEAGERQSYSSTVTELDADQEYVWGIRTTDGDHTVRSSVYSFTTEKEREVVEEGSLKVTVRDGESDRLENAYVRIKNGEYKTDRTGSNGVSKFYDLEPDRYDVKVKCDGEVETDSVRVSEGEDESVTVRMDQESSDNYCDDDDTEDLRASVTVSDTNPEIGERVRFDASGSEGDIMEYRFAFPDGTTKYGTTVYRSFDSAGEKKIQLRVTDYDYDQDTASRTIEVQNKKEYEETGSLEVTVRDDEDDRLEDAYVRARNGDYRTDYTDDDGEVKFYDLEPDRYDVRVECEDKVETDSVRVSEGEDETLEINMDFDSSDNFCDGERDGDDPEADLDIDPSSAEIGEEIEFDASGSSDDGEIEEYEFDLDGDGDYDVTTSDDEIERTFYEVFDGEAKLRVTDDDGNTDTTEESYEVRAGSRLSFSNVDAPDTVCDGESFDVSFDVENIGDRERLTIIEGEGFGDIQSYSTLLEEDEEERATITFNAEGTGTKKYSIEAKAGNSDRISRSVDVLECDRDTEVADGISLKLNPERVKAGEPVKASGYIGNTRGTEEVDIEINGRTVKEIETRPDGYYSTFIYPEETGSLTVTAVGGDEEADRTLEVLPTVRVGALEMPYNIFEGDRFEICAEVNSQNIPVVMLRRNGEILESKNERGEVCFETEAPAGETEYEVVGLARGESSSSSKTVDIHESRPETTSFPGKIASIESGDGIVKATIYNNNRERRSYEIELWGLPDNWVSTSEKEVILQPGEEREVFFYLTPQEEGTDTANIRIRSDDSMVYEESVEVITGGTSKPQRKSLVERLRNTLYWW